MSERQTSATATNERATSARRGRSTGAHVLALLCARVAAASVSAMIGLVVPRALGVVDSAHYGIAVGIAMMFVVLSDMGFTTSLSRALVERRVDAHLLRRIALLRLLMAVGAGALLAGFGLVTQAGVISGARASDGLVPSYFMLAGGLVVASSMSGMAAGLLPTMRRVRALLLITIVQPLLEFAGILVAVWLGAGAHGIIIASTCAAALAGGAGLAVALVGVRERGDVEVGIDRATARSIAAYGWPMFLVSVSFTLFGQIDQLVIYFLRGPEEAAQYIWNWRLITLMHMPGLAAASIVAPRLAGGNQQAARRLYARWMRILGVAYLGVAGIALAVSPWLVPVALGERYRSSWTLFCALGVYAVLLGVAPLATMAANFLGGARRRVRLGALTIALNAIIDFALVPTMGVYGAAIGTSVAFTWYVVAHAALSWRLLGGGVGAPARVGTTVAALRRGAPAMMIVLLSLALGCATASSLGVLADRWIPGFAGSAVGALGGGVVGATLYAFAALRGLRIAGIDLVADARADDGDPADDESRGSEDSRYASDNHESHDRGAA